MTTSASCSIEPDFAQIGQLRPLVVAVLHLAGELRQRDDRHIELFGESLEAGRDLRELLHAIFIAGTRTGEQLQIVHDQQVQASLPFEAPRPRGELRDRDAAALIDVEGNALHLPRGVGDAAKIVLIDVAAADLVARHAGLLGDDARRQLFGRHFQREEADDAAIDRLMRPVGLSFELIGARDIEGDVRGESGLAHARSPGDDDEVGFLQTAHLFVEIEQARGDAGQMPVAHIGAARHVERGGERFGKSLKAAVVATRLGDRIELPFGFFDLRARRRIDRRIIGRVDDILRR